MIPESVSFDFSQITNESIITAVVGYLIVFSALVLLSLLFTYLPKFVRTDVRIHLWDDSQEPDKKDKRKKKAKSKNMDDSFNTPGEVNAAIATAIYLHLSELHDEESNIITLQKISRRYSPWSSKIYGLRNNPGQSF
ncbi:MAG: OadG family protein [Bacteroidales bacterium]